MCSVLAINIVLLATFEFMTVAAFLSIIVMVVK